MTGGADLWPFAAAEDMTEDMAKVIAAARPQLNLKPGTVSPHRQSNRMSIARK
jgi:hypothetical protein